MCIVWTTTKTFNAASEPEVTHREMVAVGHKNFFHYLLDAKIVPGEHARRVSRRERVGGAYLSKHFEQLVYTGV